MDDRNDNIFETGSSGPKSDVGTGSEKPSVSSDGITGRIDPAIARATAGGNGTSTGNGNRKSTGANVTAGSAAGPEPVKRGRGRPPGSATVAKAKDKENNLVGSTDEAIAFVHEIVASVTGIKELILEENEYKEIADAIDEAFEQSVIKLTPKQKAYVHLARTLRRIYAPLIVAIYLNRRAAMKKNASPQVRPSATVTPLRPAPASPAGPPPMDSVTVANQPEFNPFAITIDDGPAKK
ncbi:MAG: hypothetical protein KGJ13_06255 [Patescibacteria group bacterium]|nr:hypothetical protein [Patescibacteria group bacterium]